MKDQTVLKQFFPSTLFQFIVVFVVSLIFTTPVVFIKPFFLDDQFFLIVYISILMSFFILIITYKNKERGQKINFTFNIVKHDTILLMTLSVIVFQLGVNIPINETISKSVIFFDTSSRSLLFMFGVLILGPIIEEIIFRGILLKGLFQNNRPLKAILISSILFAVFHFNLLQFFVAICLGFLLGFEYYKTKSIGNTILLHAFANLIALLGRYFFIKNSDIISLWMVVICVIVSIFILIFLIKNMKISDLLKSCK